jgi:hypothetical protein
MGLLSRIHKLAVSLSIVLALFLLSTTSPGHAPFKWLSATPSWAGSPDETLTPRPPHGSASFYGATTDRPAVGQSAASPASTRVISRGGRMTWMDRWSLVWRFYLASRPHF